ncbi:hypothetical protein [Cyanobium sp. NIES-981]|uniref:hypothetical protein n=1 Tax=Cyanobium sp. NIES-981 TaxID=1851505 RepID=UPI0007DDF334|nr:hypothetical protein [Cyanobium sp. NIES-981]SBO43594.1 conserved protein of unknown function [Cyanobium sp. NIES-981]
MALGLALLLALLTAGCQRLGQPGHDAAGPLASTAPGGSLQEVPPPGGVRQLQGDLAAHHPHVRIDSPADGSVLPAVPWTLELAVQDWPLADAGSLGMGPHVVVQIDEQPPLRLSQAGPAGNPTAGGGSSSLSIELPPLEPGSHRVTAYAARPWGEAVKAAAASDQIRLARVAPNPLSQPAAGTPQLIPVSPAFPSPHQPVLIDWLLRDAPLQGLRQGDAGWRLRITVNGDSFLVDENTPLWLEGWRRGSNTVLLELVDGLGAPLNPPFNSLVREVWIDPLEPGPAWEAAALAPDQAAQLLGRQPPPPVEAAAPPGGGGAGTAWEQPAAQSDQPAATPESRGGGDRESSPSSAASRSPMPEPAPDAVEAVEGPEQGPVDGPARPPLDPTGVAQENPPPDPVVEEAVEEVSEELVEAEGGEAAPPADTPSLGGLDHSAPTSP